MAYPVILRATHRWWAPDSINNKPRTRRGKENVMKTPIRMLLSLVAAMTLCVALTGCEKSSDSNTAADKMGNAADKAGDMAEEAGDKMEDAGDAVNDAMNK
jgi:hypothetical protein